MSLKLIRIERLKLLVRMHGVKGASLYQLIGKSAAQTHNLLSGYASFGEKVARSIEEAAQLPTGWLDQVDDVPRDERRPRRPGAVPLLTEAQAGRYQDYLDGPDDAELVLTSVPVGPHTFALDVTGDAMAPDFVAGVRRIDQGEGGGAGCGRSGGCAHVPGGQARQGHRLQRPAHLAGLRRGAQRDRRRKP